MRFDSVLGLAADVVQLTQGAWYSYRRHRGDMMGAALAFYTLLSLAPLLMVAVAIAGMVFEADAARGSVMREVGQLLGAPAASAVEEWMAAASAQSSEATVLGIVLFLFGASRVFIQLESALDAVWDVPLDRDTKWDAAFFDLVRSRLLSFLMLLAFGVVVAASVLAQSMLDALAGALLPEIDAAHVIMRTAHMGLSFVTLTVGFSVAFRGSRQRPMKLRQTVLGASITTLLFMLGNALLTTYFDAVDVGAAYGAAGTVIAVLVWMVYSGQLVMYGAELTRQIAERQNSSGQ